MLVDGAPVFPGLEDAHGSAPHGPALEAPSGPLPTFVDMPASEGPPTNFGPPPYSDVVPDARANDAFAAPMPEGLHPQPNLGLTPPLPDSGSRRVAATLVDDGSLAPLPAPAYGPPPQAYGGHPSPYVAGPPMHGPMAPQRAAGSARRGGPPLVAIGVAAAVLLGGALTLAFWLKARGSSAEAADAQPLLPTPAVATVASDPPLPGAGDPPIDPAVAPVPVPQPAAPPAAKPTTTTPKPAPSASGSGKGTAPAPTSTGTAPAPKPSGSTKPKPNLVGKGKKPLILR